MAVWLGFMVGLASISEVHAMGKACLFSAVSGIVLERGQPVPGARIIRHYKWAWGNEKSTDATHTDARGMFTLPAVWRRMWLGSILPHEPVITQTILIEHAGKTYRAWLYTRGSYEDQAELKGPIHLICRLEAPEAHRGPAGQVYGMCEPQ